MGGKRGSYLRVDLFRNVLGFEVDGLLCLWCWCGFVLYYWGGRFGCGGGGRGGSSRLCFYFCDSRFIG